jgi:hypothetical protein
MGGKNLQARFQNIIGRCKKATALQRLVKAIKPNPRTMAALAPDKPREHRAA